jgi:hypothetical protein
VTCECTCGGISSMAWYAPLGKTMGGGGEMVGLHTTLPWAYPGPYPGLPTQRLKPHYNG